MLHDLRFALRMLRRQPGFTAAAVATLALGIGGSTAVFGLVDGVLLRPLPVREPERLMLIWEHSPRDNDHNVANPANVLEWRRRATSFEQIAAFAPWSASLSGRGEPVRLSLGAATANLFETLGVAPLLGRSLVAGDDVEGAPRVAVLSEGLWRARFAADPGVIGQDVVLNGRPSTVVGVMPASFAIPPGAELWQPMPLSSTAGGRYLVPVGRLKPGVTHAQAQAEMAAIGEALAHEFPDRDAGWGVNAQPLHQDLVRQARPAVLVLLGAVLLVLLVGCANLANLLLARALAREREIAVRRALGASAPQIVTQLLVESLVLALLGGALGVAAATLLTQALLAVVPAEVRALFAIDVDPRALAFALALSIASALLFGLVPALQLARRDLEPALREGARGGISRRRRRATQAVVAIEVAVSLALLVGAGLLLRSYGRLSEVDPGFRAEGVVSAAVHLGAGYEQPEPQARFFAQLVERIGAEPGVARAAAISWRPLGTGSATSFVALDRPAPAPGQLPTADVRMVTPGLFATLGIPLQQGRDFTAGDGFERSPVVIVNEHLAREMWPGRSPLGQRIRMEWGRRLDAEVIGVVGDVRLAALDRAPRATLYWPISQVPNSFMTVVARASSGPPEALLAGIRRALAGLDPALPLARPERLDQAVADALQRPRFTFALLAAFAASALGLAGLGLFGLLAYTVTQRQAELGVRLALGARPADLFRLVVSEGLTLSAAGLGLGLALAWGLSRLLEALLFDTATRDPLVFVVAPALLALVALCASLLPARRAARVQPALCLRSE
ncbi:MAG: ABC transporter permease [Vicinamibacteria bacterium]|nr:ABC transporter permease [Vicinamibacteria bacterium]